MAKRYIIVCANCDFLAEIHRTDACTCSVRCRVAAHRHPESLQRLRKQAAALDITPMSILEAGALNRLRPDVGDVVMRGEMTLEAARPAMREAFGALVMKAARASR